MVTWFVLALVFWIDLVTQDMIPSSNKALHKNTVW